MWPLIKKNWFIAALATFPVYLLISLYWMIKKEDLTSDVVLISGFFIILTASSSVTTSEQTEVKNRGYHFLRNLPVTSAEIVKAKFLLPFLGILVTTCFGVTVLLVLNGGGSGDLLTLGMAYHFLCSFIALMVVGTWYIGIFRLGMSKMIKYVWMAMILLFVGPVIVLNELLHRCEVDISAIRQEVSDLPLFIWFGFGVMALSAYWFLYRFAVKAKERQVLD